MIFCFNELCLLPLISELNSNDTKINEIIKKFLDILKRAKEVKSCNKKLELRTEKKIWEDYYIDEMKTQTLGEWLFNHMDPDYKNIFLSILNHSPYIDKEKKLFIYTYAGEKAKGFSAALFLDCPAISFSYHNDENENAIIKLESMNGEKDKFVFNFTSENQFDNYLDFYLTFEHCKNYINDLDDIKCKVKEKKFWNKLVFPDDFDNQQLEQKYVVKLVKKLCLLNSCIQSLTVGKSIFQQVKENLTDVRDESATIKADRKLLQERTKLFAGKPLPCLIHTNLDSSMRVYFKVDNEKNLIYIGYIGKHLSTKKYKRN